MTSGCTADGMARIVLRFGLCSTSLKHLLSLMLVPMLTGAAAKDQTLSVSCLQVHRFGGKHIATEIDDDDQAGSTPSRRESAARAPRAMVSMNTQAQARHSVGDDGATGSIGIADSTAVRAADAAVTEDRMPSVETLVAEDQSSVDEQELIAKWIHNVGLESPGNSYHVAGPSFSFEVHLRGVKVMELHDHAKASVVDFLKDLLKEMGKADGLENFHFKITEIHGRFLTWHTDDGKMPRTDNEVLIRCSVAPVSADPGKRARILKALDARLTAPDNALRGNSSRFAFAMKHVRVTQADSKSDLANRMMYANPDAMGEMLVPLAICAALTGMLAWLIVI